MSDLVRVSNVLTANVPAVVEDDTPEILVLIRSINARLQALEAAYLHTLRMLHPEIMSDIAGILGRGENPSEEP